MRARQGVRDRDRGRELQAVWNGFILNHRFGILDVQSKAVEEEEVTLEVGARLTNTIQTDREKTTDLRVCISMLQIFGFKCRIYVGIIVIIIIIDSHAYRSMANSYAATLRMGISFTHATTLFTIGNSIMKIVIYKSFELRRHTRISTTYNVFRGRERTTKCHIRIT